MFNPKGFATRGKFFVMCHICGTTCQGLQKSAKADILFRMLLVKQHSKIGICFASVTKKEVYLRATSFEVAMCSYGLFKSQLISASLIHAFP